jgi:ABC-2 type transport system ATP-binding protein
MVTTHAPGGEIVLSRLAKSYGNVRAVRCVDLTIANGETVALLGPNGAGKSTTIDMVLGLTRPDAGSIALFGRSPSDAVAAGLVGGMLQAGSLLPGLTVRELVTLVASLYPRPLPVDEALALTGTAGLAGRPAARLSGGRRSGSGSPGCWPPTPISCCSTSRPPPWTWKAVMSSGPRCARWPRAARP